MIQNHDLILFDLDGTISDPAQGIGRSINYALTHFGYESLSQAEIAKYIGPPLDEIFRSITGKQTDCHALVTKYRERYSEIGYTENVLYPGVTEVLLKLKSTNVPMAICTSKRQDFAEKILEMFGLNHCFRFISSGDIGISKSQQIKTLLSQDQINKSAVMIGDRAVDLIAAHKNDLQAGGVLWGYGSQDELLDENPLYLFSSPSELIGLIPVKKS
jgi:phosphoglycolate phosphatase